MTGAATLLRLAIAGASLFGISLMVVYAMDSLTGAPEGQEDDLPILDAYRTWTWMDKRRGQ